MSEYIEIEVEVIAQTPGAICVKNLKDIDTWIPRSQIDDYSGDKTSPDSIFILEWQALQKELI